ncbi:hypothetical protein IWQ60_002090 [Tieghemiomyces parasiticus]|uniref:NADH-ubiquinone oxidoreductase subunit B14.5a n=1 Tax=Tieghemiomyces parasiticus TaxID=78921 RepID=A0A9W8AIL3_9FUNG|nr:hypothetical protein IWQ60_002090 [Tieghemiomyces parasiticus]
MSRLWNAVKRRLQVNPDAADSMFNPGTYRKPSPDSQKKFVPPITDKFNISNNYYFQRDVRRNYPRMAIYSQAYVAQLLAPPAPSAPALEDGKTESAAAPVDAKGEGATAVAATSNLTEVIRNLGQPLYTASQPPPVPGLRYKYTISEQLQHQKPGVYFPIYNVH